MEINFTLPTKKKIVVTADKTVDKTDPNQPSTDNQAKKLKNKRGARGKKKSKTMLNDLDDEEDLEGPEETPNPKELTNPKPRKVLPPRGEDQELYTPKLAKKMIKEKLNEKVKVAKIQMTKDFIPNLLNKNEVTDQTLIFAERKFSELGLSPALMKSLERAGYETMTRIQDEIYSRAIQRRNCLIRAVTGSGKTLAYLLPIYQDLLTLGFQIKRTEGIYAVIVCPTKELCQQIYDECIKISYGCIWIVPGKFVGGETFNHEKSRLRKGINIMIGTPSRVAYHLQNSNNSGVKNLRSVVIEECDLSMSLGQGNSIKTILEIISKKEFEDAQYCLKLFTTASFNNKVKEMMDKVVKNDYDLVGEFDIEKLDSSKQAGEILVPEQLKHNYVTIDEENKFSFLLCLLHSMKDKKIIIFVSTADQANFVESLINETRHLPPRSKEGVEEEKEMERLLGVKVFKLHGHIDHEARKNAYEGFKALQTGVLISTDVGSRGLDFAKVDLIVLLDPPETLSHYSNKVGRTARLANVGAALTILHPAENSILEKLRENFEMHEMLSGPIFSDFEKNGIPEYYSIVDAMIYLRHSIKKVLLILTPSEFL